MSEPKSVVESQPETVDSILMSHVKMKAAQLSPKEKMIEDKIKSKLRQMEKNSPLLFSKKRLTNAFSYRNSKLTTLPCELIEDEERRDLTKLHNYETIIAIRNLEKQVFKEEETPDRSVRETLKNATTEHKKSIDENRLYPMQDFEQE